MARCAVAILAAGHSTRFPSKLLASLWGKHLVWWPAEAARKAAVGPIYVVAADREIPKAAGPIDGVVYNPWRDAGLSTSIKAAISALIHVEKIIFLPGDMPLVKPETIQTVCQTQTEGLAVPTHGGKRGNPVAITKKAYATALLALDGDVGLRALIGKIPTTYVEVEDRGIHIDVDTPQDLSHLNTDL